jgi:predicted nucleic acid-binding Zn ribbon protein
MEEPPAARVDYGVTMPTYSFRDKHTGEEFDVFMSISELDEFLENHPELEKLLSAPHFLGAQMNGGLKNNKSYDPKGKS